LKNFRYQIYYEYNGPSHADPFRTEKTDQQIRDALDNIGTTLSGNFPNDSIEIIVSPIDSHMREVCINTEMSEKSFYDAFKRSLNSHDLFARKLPLEK
jgi:hypothetical protein